MAVGLDWGGKGTGERNGELGFTMTRVASNVPWFGWTKVGRADLSWRSGWNLSWATALLGLGVWDAVGMNVLKHCVHSLSKGTYCMICSCLLVIEMCRVHREVQAGFGTKTTCPCPNDDWYRYHQRRLIISRTSISLHCTGSFERLEQVLEMDVHLSPTR